MRGHNKSIKARIVVGFVAAKTTESDKQYRVTNQALMDASRRLQALREQTNYKSPCQEDPRLWDAPTDGERRDSWEYLARIGEAIDRCMSCQVFMACDAVRQANETGGMVIEGVLAGVETAIKEKPLDMYDEDGNEIIWCAGTREKHPRNEENTYRKPNGREQCRPCMMVATREWNEKRREQRRAAKAAREQAA